MTELTSQTSEYRVTSGADANALRHALGPVPTLLVVPDASGPSNASPFAATPVRPVWLTAHRNPTPNESHLAPELNV